MLSRRPLRRVTAQINAVLSSSVLQPFASSVVTQETTLEDSMRNNAARSKQSLSPSVSPSGNGCRERSELRMKTAIGYAVEHSTESLSPFVSREAATTGASPSGNG